MERTTSHLQPSGKVFVVCLSVAGAASVALMSATNFLLYSNIRWLLLLPALLGLAGLLCYLRESAASPTIETQALLLDRGQARRRRPPVGCH